MTKPTTYLLDALRASLPLWVWSEYDDARRVVGTYGDQQVTIQLPRPTDEVKGVKIDTTGAGRWISPPPAIPDLVTAVREELTKAITFGQQRIKRDNRMVHELSVSLTRGSIPAGYQQSLFDTLRLALPRLDWATHADRAITGRASGALVTITWEHPDAAPPRPVMSICIGWLKEGEQFATYIGSEPSVTYGRLLDPADTVSAVRDIIRRFTAAAPALTAVALLTEPT